MSGDAPPSDERDSIRMTSRAPERERLQLPTGFAFNGFSFNGLLASTASATNGMTSTASRLNGMNSNGCRTTALLYNGSFLQRSVHHRRPSSTGRPDDDRGRSPVRQLHGQVRGPVGHRLTATIKYGDPTRSRAPWRIPAIGDSVRPLRRRLPGEDVGGPARARQQLWPSRWPLAGRGRRRHRLGLEPELPVPGGRVLGNLFAGNIPGQLLLG